jgi:hypothetical protein
MHMEILATVCSAAGHKKIFPPNIFTDKKKKKNSFELFSQFEGCCKGKGRLQIRM